MSTSVPTPTSTPAPTASDAGSAATERDHLADLVEVVRYTFPSVRHLATARYDKAQNWFKRRHGPTGAQKKWRRKLYTDALRACGSQAQFVYAVTNAFPTVTILFDDAYYTFRIIDLQFIAYLKTRTTKSVRWFKSRANKGHYDADGMIFRFYHWPQEQEFVMARLLFETAIQGAPGLIDHVKGERRKHDENGKVVKKKKSRSIYLASTTPVPILAKANRHHVELTINGATEVKEGLDAATIAAPNEESERFANKATDGYRIWLDLRQKESTLDLALIFARTCGLEGDMVTEVAILLHEKVIAA